MFFAFFFKSLSQVRRPFRDFNKKGSGVGVCVCVFCFGKCRSKYIYIFLSWDQINRERNIERKIGIRRRSVFNFLDSFFGFGCVFFLYVYVSIFILNFVFFFV